VTLTIENTFNPGPNRLEGTITFPLELKAGARVQVGYSVYRKGFDADLESDNGMNSIDLPVAAKQIDFVFTGLTDGEVTVHARAFSGETMAKVNAQLLEAHERFKKTGKATMAPTPPWEFGGFYTGTQTVALEGLGAKVIALSGGPTQTGLKFALAAIDNSEPPPFSGTLTVKAILKMKTKVRSFDDWDTASALLERSLGKPSAISDTRLSWGVVEGERCVYLDVKKDQRSKFFKDQTGFMVGGAAIVVVATAMAPTDSGCLTAAGARRGH